MPRYIVKETTEQLFLVEVESAGMAIEAVANRNLRPCDRVEQPRTFHNVREVESMIPKSEYLFIEHVGNVITDELLKKHHTEKDVEVFYKWMRGQTCTELNGKAAIYSWDYERWLRQGKKTQQGADWD